MLVHTVLFWLKSDLADETRTSIIAALQSLDTIETVRQLHVGQPIPSTRPVVDTSYSVGLQVLFDDQAGLDTYQVHPQHMQFLETFSPCWDRVLVYDFA